MDNNFTQKRVFHHPLTGELLIRIGSDLFELPVQCGGEEILKLTMMGFLSSIESEEAIDDLNEIVSKENHDHIGQVIIRSSLGKCLISHHINRLHQEILANPLISLN